MSVATTESLEALEKEQLIAEVIKYQTGYTELVNKYNNDIGILNTSIAELTKTNAELTAAAATKGKPNEKVKALQDTIAAKDQEILELKEEINTKNLKLKDINQMINENSRDWYLEINEIMKLINLN